MGLGLTLAAGAEPDGSGVAGSGETIDGSTGDGAGLVLAAPLWAGPQPTTTKSAATRTARDHGAAISAAGPGPIVLLDRDTVSPRRRHRRHAIPAALAKPACDGWYDNDVLTD
jgi:hypothetical protein